jgi:hypothetical protein
MVPHFALLTPLPAEGKGRAHRLARACGDATQNAFIYDTHPQSPQGAPSPGIICVPDPLFRLLLNLGLPHDLKTHSSDLRASAPERRLQLLWPKPI